MSFDYLAPHYRWMEVVSAGEKLQRCRTAFLDAITPPENVLICGEGNGRFLVSFCQRFPRAEVTCLDASAGMLDQARRRADRGGVATDLISFLHADILDWKSPPATYDLIVTHFFLDCFTEQQLQKIVPSISRAAKPRSEWLLADFKVAKSGFKRARSVVILALMYAFFRRAARLPARSLTPPDAFLANEGFERKVRVEVDWGLLHSDLWGRQP